MSRVHTAAAEAALANMLWCDKHMEIPIIVDGALRGRIQWDGPIDQVLPDDIRIARKLKSQRELWDELVSKRIASIAFDGNSYTVHTKAGPGGAAAPRAAGSAQFRVLEPDHPFHEACDFGEKA